MIDQCLQFTRIGIFNGQRSARGQLALVYIRWNQRTAKTIEPIYLKFSGKKSIKSTDILRFTMEIFVYRWLLLVSIIVFFVCLSPWKNGQLYIASSRLINIQNKNLNIEQKLYLHNTLCLKNNFGKLFIDFQLKWLTHIDYIVQTKPTYLNNTLIIKRNRMSMLRFLFLSMRRMLCMPGEFATLYKSKVTNGPKHYLFKFTPRSSNNMIVNTGYKKSPTIFRCIENCRAHVTIPIFKFGEWFSGEMKRRQNGSWPTLVPNLGDYFLKIQHYRYIIIWYSIDYLPTALYNNDIIELAKGIWAYYNINTRSAGNLFNAQTGNKDIRFNTEFRVTIMDVYME
ncbi:hypothetical protein AGLY_011756 [Aphis glycines]|uniref:Uncharacterized protein n=1 Tax=Aphis glycines TaxID=307491 RepID=A0A6G0TDB3_APHGL|nr:hypothetical protein AGLY_011756 [Aphis glycines]